MSFACLFLTPAELKQHLQNHPTSIGFLKVPSGILKVSYTSKGAYKTDFVDEQSLDLTQCSFLKETDIKTLLLAGTPFQQKVWQAALSIPAGKVTSYQGLARMINNPAASRAVGTALGANPLVYLVPCHRIIRTDGTLGGFGCGLPLKEALLNAESSAEIVRS